MNYDRAALKCEVKEDMRLIRPRPLLATLIFLLVSAALTGLIQWLQSWMTAGGIQELMDLMGLVEMAEYGLISDEELVQAVVELFGSVGSVAGISMLFALLSSLITWTATRATVWIWSAGRIPAMVVWPAPFPNWAGSCSPDFW